MLLRRISTQDVGPNGPTYLTVWIIFQIAAGHVALPILAVTMLFKKNLKKRAPLINACATWIVSSVCYSLLFYVNRSKSSDPQPSSDLCVGQASLVGAIPILTCTATFVLAYDLLRTYDDPDVPEHGARAKRVTISQVIIPYAAFGIFVAIGVILSVQHNDRVNREQRYFYCSLDWNPLTYAVAFMSAIICLAAAAIEVHVVSIGMRHRRLARRAGRQSIGDISLLLRIFCFTLYLLASTVVNLVSNWVDMSVVPDLLSASIGVVFFLLFATRKDIIQTWFFWCRPAPTRSVHISSPSQPYIPFLPNRDLIRDTMDTDRTSKNTYTSSMMLKDYYETKGPGVKIIGRPDEAFSRVLDESPHV